MKVNFAYVACRRTQLNISFPIFHCIYREKVWCHVYFIITKFGNIYEPTREGFAVAKPTRGFTSTKPTK